MIAATRRSFPSPFQKFSSSSSSSSSGERSRGISPVAKDGNPYKPHAGGPLQVERRDETAHGIRDVVHRNRCDVSFEIVEAVELRTELGRRNALVDVPVDYERRSSPQEDRLEGLRPQFGPPLFFLPTHRHIRWWIVREEDPRAVSRQEPVEDFHPPFVLVRDAGQILPLPPRRPVQAADAPADANAPRRRLQDRPRGL